MGKFLFQLFGVLVALAIFVMLLLAVFYSGDRIISSLSNKKTTTKEVKQVVKEEKDGLKIDRAWVEHNIYDIHKDTKERCKGMRIHVEWEAKNYQNHSINFVAYFYDNDIALDDTNQSYYTTEGHVSSGFSYSPNTDILINKVHPRNA